ncbi:MAG: hypothetical protein ACFBSC_08190 [Microcoleaceae cyanobacterium]
MNNIREDSIATFLGIDFDPSTQFFSGAVCDFLAFERSVEAEIEQILSLPQCELYIQCFDEFGFGLRIQATLLAYIYPFESFLVGGKPFKAHEYKEVKRREKDRVDGKTIVKFQPGQRKRIRRDVSRDSFSMMLGGGTVCEFSGDQWVEVSAGHELPRVVLWRWVFAALETGKLSVASSTVLKLVDYRDSLKELQTR